MIKWLMNEESGQGMVEYGLILALISVVVIFLLSGIGESLNKAFGKINEDLKTSTDGLDAVEPTTK